MRLSVLSKLCFDELVFLFMLLSGKRVDYVCSELDTNRRKRDGSMLFEESAHNVCCWAEVGWINPSCASHEMGCVETQGLGYFITGY